MTYAEKMLAALSAGDLADAQLNFEKTQREDSAEIRASLAEELLQMGFLDESEQLIQQLLAEFPEEDSLKVMLAEIAIEDGETDKAFSILETIPAGSGSYSQSLVLQADLYQLLGLPEVSENKLLEAKKYLPDEPLLDFALAELYFSEEQYARALELYLMLNASSTFEAPVNLAERIGVSYTRLGEFETAVAYLEDAVKDTGSDDTLYELAITYMQLEESAKAITLLQQLQAVNPDYMAVYYPLAKMLHDEGRHQEARDVLQQGLAASPFTVPLYHLASTNAYSLGMVELAEDYLHQALEMEEDKDHTLLKLSELLINEARYDEVVSLLSGLENPDQGFAHWYLAQAYNGLEQFDEARTHYRRAFNWLGSEPDFLKEYGLFLREDGLLEESQSILTRYLHLVPGDIEILSLLDD